MGAPGQSQGSMRDLDEVADAVVRHVKQLLCKDLM